MDYDCFSKLATLLNKPCYSRYNYISVSILFNTFMYPVPFRYCYTIKKVWNYICFTLCSGSRIAFGTDKTIAHTNIDNI